MPLENGVTAEHRSPSAPRHHRGQAIAWPRLMGARKCTIGADVQPIRGGSGIDPGLLRARCKGSMCVGSRRGGGCCRPSRPHPSQGRCARHAQSRAEGKRAPRRPNLVAGVVLRPLPEERHEAHAPAAPRLGERKRRPVGLRAEGRKPLRVAGDQGNDAILLADKLASGSGVSPLIVCVACVALQLLGMRAELFQTRADSARTRPNEGAAAAVLGTRRSERAVDGVDRGFHFTRPTCSPVWVSFWFLPLLLDSSSLCVSEVRGLAVM